MVSLVRICGAAACGRVRLLVVTYEALAEEVLLQALTNPAASRAERFDYYLRIASVCVGMDSAAKLSEPAANGPLWPNTWDTLTGK